MAACAASWLSARVARGEGQVDAGLGAAAPVEREQLGEHRGQVDAYVRAELDGLDAGPDAPQYLLVGRGQHHILSGEVVLDGADGHAGAGGHIPDADLLQPAFGDDAQQRLGDRGLSRHRI